ncbi:TetR family transcriptional regulator [Mycolicibacterium thermoresistibile ATCC 19527]|uniref:TetR family transcriptional regulator n=1 Tax=Mycolicibacterium thermoresistibile (strain ATCC 19527 / DSM 44167 / CIP 105390 / JCM 6362 / NCTC 10409 / 316) TaxID=1078020 RepID=G7CDP8_MYCT3|nr:TetR family transcriptional regulator [Mycolicibacterium thermoresistibile ATCC 19527]
MLYQEVVQQTNSLVVAEGMERAKRETTLLGRLSAFFTAAMQAESEDRSTAAFLVISVLESQRHPELTIDEFDALKNSRAFVTWAVNDAIERGELTTNTDVSKIVEMLVAVLWGMGFYAGYVGRQEDLKTVVEQFELLLANKLWQLKS